MIVFLIPLALKGVSYKPMSAAAPLRRNLWLYRVGGLRCRSSASNDRPDPGAARRRLTIEEMNMTYLRHPL